MEQQVQVHSPFTIKQREIFARLLEEAKTQAEAELQSEDDIKDQVEEEFIPKLAQEQGASDLIEKVRKLRKEAEEAEEALTALGFNCNDDTIKLKWNAPKPLRDALKAAKREAQKERLGQLKKFDRALLKVWAAQTAEQAQKIVEDLL